MNGPFILIRVARITVHWFQNQITCNFNLSVTLLIILVLHRIWHKIFLQVKYWRKLCFNKNSLFLLIMVFIFQLLFIFFVPKNYFYFMFLFVCFFLFLYLLLIGCINFLNIYIFTCILFLEAYGYFCFTDLFST